MQEYTSRIFLRKEKDLGYKKECGLKNKKRIYKSFPHSWSRKMLVQIRTGTLGLMSKIFSIEGTIHSIQ